MLENCRENYIFQNGQVHMHVYVYRYSKKQQASPKPENKPNQRNKENFQTLKKETEKILRDRKTPIFTDWKN